MGQFFGSTNPAVDAGWSADTERQGFFTDTSICIGCKACEVACKQWNNLPAETSPQLRESSYDNTGALGSNTWRHVAFIEQDQERIEAARESGRALVDLGMPRVRGEIEAEPKEGVPAKTQPLDVLGGLEQTYTPPDTPEFRWLMSSDVCKHCTHAGCLDVCPTGSLFRTEFGTVVVQDDICNGCGVCVAACPFGVIERRPDGAAEVGIREPAGGPEQAPGGIAQKCTLCYDRLVDGQTPACAQACPTTSIKFGDREEMVTEANTRLRDLHAQGMTEARLYGANDGDGVGGTGSIFLLLDEPEVYGLPPDPQVCTANLPRTYVRAGFSALGMLLTAVWAFKKGRRQ